MRQPRTLTFLLLLLATLSGCSETRNTAAMLPVHCLDRPDPGPCTRRIPAFFYDYPSDTCRSFYYGGCRGQVPFRSRETCEQTCVARRR